MPRCVRVPKKEGEPIRARLASEGLLDLDSRIRADGDCLLIPILCDSYDGLEVVDAEMQVQEHRPKDFREIADVPEELRDMLPNSFDVVGDVAMMRLPDELIPYKQAIGEALRRASRVVGEVPLVVTENGVATADDAERVEYLHAPLVYEAVQISSASANGIIE
jgi:tRNA (guanine37-N1)-methyltransferase